MKELIKEISAAFQEKAHTDKEEFGIEWKVDTVGEIVAKVEHKSKGHLARLVTDGTTTEMCISCEGIATNEDIQHHERLLNTLKLCKLMVRRISKRGEE